MKYFALILFYLSHLILNSVSAAGPSNNDLELNVETKDQFYQKLLIPLWQEIPTRFHMEPTDLGNLGSNVHARLNYANIDIFKKGKALFSLSPKEDNNFNLKWHLNDFQLTSEIKVTFRYKKLGIKITHNEIFILKAHKILNANSHFKINFDKKLEFLMSNNEGFLFEHVDLIPRDGLGKTLKWIFTHIYSEQELKDKLREKVNQELSKWINKPYLKNTIQDIANNELSQIEDLNIPVNDLATQINIKLKKLNFSKNSINIAASTFFNNEGNTFHQCAHELEQTSNTNINSRDRFGIMNSPEITDIANGDVFTSHHLIEESLNNLIQYKRYDKENNLLEPILCFGYQDLNEKGEPKGVQTQAEILFKTFNFTYIAHPKIRPSFIYDEKRQQLELDMKMAIEFSSEEYPKIFTSKNKEVIAQIKVQFQLEFNEGEGVSLIFKRLAIPNIEGPVYARTFKYTPKFKLPVSKLKKILSNEITARIKQDNEKTLIFTGQIPFENFIFNLNDYKFNKNGHSINFDLLFKNQ